MAQLNLPNVRVESDVRFKVTLTDNGVAVNWTSLTGIRAFAYSDSQRIMAGELEASIDSEDSTKLIVNYKSAEVPQYLGIVRLVVRGMYLTRKKTFDKPVINFVATTAQATGVTVITDPEVDVTIAVTEVSTSLLDEAIDACILATADAVDAAERAEAAAEHGPYIHATSKHWMVWSDTTQAYVDTGIVAEGQGSEVKQTTGQSTTAVMSQKAVTDNLATKIEKVSGATMMNIPVFDENGGLTDENYSPSDFEAAGMASILVSTHNASAAAHGGVEGKVTAIEGKIPSQASSENKLADKEFVNSSIATATATFRGTFDCTGEYVAINKEVSGVNTIQLTDVQKFFFWGYFPEGKLDKIDFTYDEENEEYTYSAKNREGNVIKSGVLGIGDYDDFTSGNYHFRIEYVGGDELLTLFVKSLSSIDANAFDFVSLDFGTPDANDYCYILREMEGNRRYDRYKFAPNEYAPNENPWQYEYTLNNSSFTAAQWAAINSGISAGLIPSGTTSTNKLTNAADVAAAIAAGAEVFTAIYGSTTYADILAAYNAGKLVVGKHGTNNGLVCYIDNASTPKDIYFSSQTDYFYMWKVNENDEWSGITREWENVSRKVTTLSAGSTDAQYPSAKCVYDALQAGGGNNEEITAAGLVDLHETQLDWLNGRTDKGKMLFQSMLVDNLDSYNPEAPLSANQGRVLNGKFSEIEEVTASAFNDIVKGQGVIHNIAAPYRAYETYAVGAYVTYEGLLWKCDTAVSTPELFDATKWHVTTVMAEVLLLTQ